MNELVLELVMKVYSDRYQSIMDRIWPTMGSNGFNETNQTHNFLNAYEEVANKNGETVSSWCEFQIPNGDKKNNRIDGLIINHSSKELYLIEAKRCYKHQIPKLKCNLAEDFLRTESLDIQTRGNSIFNGEESISDYSSFGILLFDLWMEDPPCNPKKVGDKNHICEKCHQKFLADWKHVCKTKKAEDFVSLLGMSNEDTDLVTSGRLIVPSITGVGKHGYYLAALVWKRS